MSESQNENNNFCIECSDDENYSNSEDNYRVVNRKRIWEPNGDQIESLYGELETKGFIELKWYCPGRRSPSVNSLINTINSQKTDICDQNHDNNDINKINDLNEFDFEHEFNNETIHSINTKVNQTKRRSNHGLKKSQTNLSKVMQDIKKYQLIEQQSKKLSLATVSNTLTANTQPISVSLPSTSSTPQTSADISSNNQI